MLSSYTLFLEEVSSYLQPSCSMDNSIPSGGLFNYYVKLIVTMIRLFVYTTSVW